ncbi:MAG: hypothetical protein ABI591_08515 [Kofleriaceae bacterium]
MTVDEWDHREVCPDGACTGVIGAEGRCKVCGQVSPTWNNERERGMIVDGEHLPHDDHADDEEDDDDDDDDADDDVAARGSDPALAALMPGAATDDVDWSRRVLCRDDTCIGVLDARKVCSVCGKTWANG